MFVNYYNKSSQVTQVGSHGIEASYITVHSRMISYLCQFVYKIANTRYAYYFDILTAKQPMKFA